MASFTAYKKLVDFNSSLADTDKVSVFGTWATTSYLGVDGNPIKIKIIAFTTNFRDDMEREYYSSFDYSYDAATHVVDTMLNGKIHRAYSLDSLETDFTGSVAELDAKVEEEVHQIVKPVRFYLPPHWMLHRDLVIRCICIESQSRQ